MAAGIVFRIPAVPDRPSTGWVGQLAAFGAAALPRAVCTAPTHRPPDARRHAPAHRPRPALSSQREICGALSSRMAAKHGQSVRRMTVACGQPRTPPAETEARSMRFVSINAQDKSNIVRLYIAWMAIGARTLRPTCRAAERMIASGSSTNGEPRPLARCAASKIPPVTKSRDSSANLAEPD